MVAVIIIDIINVWFSGDILVSRQWVSPRLWEVISIIISIRTLRLSKFSGTASATWQLCIKQESWRASCLSSV